MQQDATAPLPPGWLSAWDTTHQAHYYYNAAAGITQWEPPAPPRPLVQAATPAAPPAAIAPAAAGAPVAPGGAAAARYCYLDPSGVRRGPFTAAELRGWRQHLPMDLRLLPVVDDHKGGAATCSGADAGHGSCTDEQRAEGQLEGPGPEGERRGPSGDGQAPEGVTGVTRGEESPSCAAPAPATAVVEAEAPERQSDSLRPEPPQQGREVQHESWEQQQQQQQQQQQEQQQQEQQQQQQQQEQQQVEDTQRQQQQHVAQGDPIAGGGQLQGVELAVVLGDGPLLAAWRAAAAHWPPALRSVAPGCGSGGGGGGGGGAPRAPPAPIWEAWQQQHRHQPHDPWRWQQQQQRQQQQHAPAGSGAGENMPSRGSPVSGGGGVGGAGGSFAEYAEAVLAGLPPTDDAVVLAKTALYYGRPLEEVMTAAAAAGPGSSAAAPPSSRGGGGCAGWDVEFVRDPRSGRLTAVYSGAGAAAPAAAARLYGDLE
ncbi:hypothetical protein MNEG_13969, partial [Monoraphidium neglectum]